jgi:hypothetical protein
MPDQIGDYYVLNKLQPPADHGRQIQKITRDYVDGDAWQFTASRAEETVHQAAFFVTTALAARQLKELLKAMQGTAGVTMVCDGLAYTECVIIQVRDFLIVPIQRRSRCYDAVGVLTAGGVSGRIVRCTFVVGRSNAPA